MSAIALLIGLLALSYIGSNLVGGRAIRGYGLPSGAEYVFVGFLLGPHAFGLVDRPTLHLLEPIVQVGMAWIAFAIGVDYGFVGTRRVPIRRLLLGRALAVFSLVGVAAAFAAFAIYATHLRGQKLLIAAIGVGAVSCETTRHAVRWVVERYSARGPISELVADIADGDDVVPLLAVTLAFALAPSRSVTMELPVWGFALATLGVGVLLGGLASALLRVEDRATETWGILLGAALFGIGIAARLGKSELGLLFALGLTIALLSGRRTEIRSMVGGTESAILLPVLVVSGAFVDLRTAPWLSLAVLVVLVARVAVKWTSGALLRIFRETRRAGSLLGFGLLPSGALTMAFGLAFAFRFDDAVGGSVLVIAAAVTLFGELVGPTSLKRALQRAGEIEIKSAPLHAAPAAPDKDEEPEIS